MKGLILAAGKGSRLRPITFAIPKPLVPIANRPTFLYAVESFNKSGIKEIGIVINKEHQKEFRRVLEEKYNTDNISLIIQEEPLGIANAIMEARDFVGDEPFLVQLGDNIIFHNYSSFIAKDVRAKVLLARVDDISRFGIAEIEKDKIINLIEKPDKSSSNLALVGLYLFNNEIFDFINQLKPSRNGEYEITDAINSYICKYRNLDYEVCDNWWKDTGTPKDMLNANSFILQHKLESETIIGEDSNICNVNLNKYVSIGNGCCIKNCKIENSIILDNVCIKNVDICNSIIGDNCTLRYSNESRLKMELFFGNNTIINIK